MLGIFTLNMRLKPTSVASNLSGSFYRNVSVDSKITVSKDVADVSLEHGVTLGEEDEIV